MEPAISSPIRHALVLALLTFSGCGGSLRYRLPPGVEAFLPGGAGYPCEPGWWSGDTIEVIAHVSGATFRTLKPGTATVHCPKSTIHVTVEELARLELSGPDRVELRALIDPEFRLQGYGTSGQELDLDIVAEPEVTWTAPDSVAFKQPRCGHMAAICSGFAGSGKSIRVRPKAAGTVEVQVAFQGKTASRSLTVEPSGKVSEPESAPDTLR